MATPPQLQLNTLLKHYLISKELGAGCFGRVYEAIDTKNDNQLVALKCVSKSLQKSSPKAYQLFQAERTILEKIKNENVVGFVDYFESPNVCFLCLEYCNEGDLEQYLAKKNGKRVPEHEAIEYFKQILNGFQSLHENNILHRDMKLPNILKHNGQLKIADLGFAKELRSDRALTATVLGTPYTMAPEVLEEKPYGLSCDIYSIGVNFYQVIYGKYPFNGRSEYELIQNIKKQNIDFKVPGVQVSNNLIDLLRQMLQYDISKRIKMENIWQHPVFSDEVKPNANIGMQNLYTSQINRHKNIDYYKNQQNQPKPALDPFQVQPDNQNPFQIDEKPEQKSHVEDILKTVVNNKKADQEIKQVIQYYLNEINTTNQIGKCVDSSHHLPETGINTFYPVFFMLKKVLHQQTRVLKDMENRVNVFNCNYPEKLFSNVLYTSIKNDLKVRLETYQAFYMARKFDMEDLMQQTPDPDITKELDDQYTPITDRFFRQTMMNYYVNLIDEMNKWKNTNINNAIAFQKHIVEVLDCLGLDQFFRSKPNFNFDDYQTFKDNIDYQSREKLISDKALTVFPPRK